MADYASTNPPFYSTGYGLSLMRRSATSEGTEMMSGIFISKGVSLRIPKGGLVLTFGENAVQQPVRVEVSFDACPSWMEIALDHLAIAKGANTARAEAWKGDVEEAKGRSLESEFKSSMQSITAAAISIESFCAALEKKIKVDAPVKAVRKSRGPRFAQVAEACAAAFELSDKDIEDLRGNLAQIFKFRNRTVHPSGDFSQPVLHPELGIGVEWRFITFRFENTLPLVWAAVNSIAGLVFNRKASNEEVQKYSDYLKPQFVSFRSNTILAGWTPPTSGQVV